MGIDNEDTKSLKGLEGTYIHLNAAKYMKVSILCQKDRHNGSLGHTIVKSS